MHKLHQRVGLALLLLLIIATAGFVLNDNYLFSGLALHNMDQIDKTGLLRSYGEHVADCECCARARCRRRGVFGVC